MNRDMRYNFNFGRAWQECLSSNEDDTKAHATRSTVVEDDYWVVDLPAAACEVVDTRRLDRYPLEQILTLDHHTPLLLLV